MLSLPQQDSLCHLGSVRAWARLNIYGLAGAAVCLVVFNVPEMTFLSCCLMPTQLRLIGGVTWRLMKSQHYQSADSQVSGCG